MHNQTTHLSSRVLHHSTRFFQLTQLNICFETIYQLLISRSMFPAQLTSQRKVFGAFGFGSAVKSPKDEKFLHRSKSCAPLGSRV
ncbi:hypothetical protein B0H12DRAFT_1125493 [Mycena haematopus]|nr:hypothetical protein B0H12DRAFT_1145820 [Mycena haematopus]KAJ7247182.1 hypothetical protein B0H12DRAFT_1125493 [Mycena haematopus]